MEFHNNRVGDFCKRIKSQQSDPAKKIPVHCEIQFSNKKRHNETMKTEANQSRFFLAMVPTALLVWQSTDTGYKASNVISALN